MLEAALRFCAVGVILLGAGGCSSDTPGLTPIPSGATVAGADSSGGSATGGLNSFGGVSAGSGSTPSPSTAGSTAIAGASSGGMSGTGAAGAAGAAGGPVAPARVLCLGDSITEAEDAWVYSLQDLLVERSCRFELIGYDEGPYNGPYAMRPGYGHRRIAAGGFSTTGILNLIKERGLGGTPDVVLEYLGVNNQYGGFVDGKYNPDNSNDPTGSFLKDNREIIALVRAQNPAVAFLLMKPQNGSLPNIGAAIDELVATESTSASPVISVEGAVGVETGDGIHPTEAGSKTLAGPVGSALADLLAKHGLCPL